MKLLFAEICFPLPIISQHFISETQAHICTPLQHASKLLCCFKTVPQSPVGKKANAKQHWDVSTTPEAAISYGSTAVKYLISRCSARFFGKW